MRPQVVTVSALQISSPIPVNWREKDFALGLQVGLSAGSSLTYSVQFTNDDPENFTDPTDFNTNATWQDFPDLSGLTASDFAGYEFPVRAVRLNVTSYTSGSATLTALQAT